MDRQSRVKEILTELRDLWAQRTLLDEREAELERELVGTDDIQVVVRAAKDPAEKEQRRDVLKHAAEKRGMLAVERDVTYTPQGGKGPKRMPRWLRPKVLDFINDNPERGWSARELVEQLDCVVHEAAVNNMLGALFREGFIKRAHRGVYQAQTDAEPQMKPATDEPEQESEDALDQERGSIDDVSVLPSQDEISELEALS